MPVEPDETEWGFRVRRYEQLKVQYDGDLDADVAETSELRRSDRPELEQILEAFRSSVDVQAFSAQLDSWSRAKPHFGFSSQYLGMFLKQLVADGESQATAQLLLDSIQAPSSEDVAQRRMDELGAFVEDLRERGSAAAVGRILQFLSWFWWLEAPEEWPVAWVTARRALDHLGFGLPSDTTQWERYASEPAWG